MQLYQCIPYTDYCAFWVFKSLQMHIQLRNVYKKSMLVYHSIGRKLYEGIEFTRKICIV